LPETRIGFETFDELFETAGELPEAERHQVFGYNTETEEWDQIPWRDSPCLNDGRLVGDVSANQRYYRVIQYGDVLESVREAVLEEDLEIEDGLGDRGLRLPPVLPTLRGIDDGKDPPGIKTRKNSVVTGNTPRDQAVKEQQDLGYKKMERKTRIRPTLDGGNILLQPEETLRRNTQSKNNGNSTKRDRKETTDVQHVAKMAKKT